MDSRQLEELIGFSLRRPAVRLEEGIPHDERYSYFLCQRFFGKDEELLRAITLALASLRQALKDRDRAGIVDFASLLCCMHYLRGDFPQSAGYATIALSYERQDLTIWVDLLFAVRGMGEFALFEQALFNLPTLYQLWKSDPETVFSQDKFVRMLDRIG
jgi:hypothetical protein